jgi:acyl-CoA reductase-like NAD-dependent aldehyde dehydrogenase
MQTHWIDGRALTGSGKAIDILDPATEELIDTIPRGHANDVEAAVAAARRAFEPWAARSPMQRRQLILTAIDRLTLIRDEVAHLLTREMGKPLSHALNEVNKAIEGMRSNAEMVIHLRSGQQMAADLELNFQQRFARGVAACVMPWNFPVALGLDNVVPNLLVGNTVVWKPSEKTPLTSRLIVERIFDHLPAGVINVLLGDGPTVGDALVRHPQVDLLVFVGSEPTGRHLGAICGQSLKKAILELGGKDALIIDDTVDVTAAARLAAEAAFSNAGQICTSTERLYVARKIFPEFVAALTAQASAIRQGNGLTAGIQMGPLVDQQQLQIVSLQVQEALDAGATLHHGGARLAGKGFFYPPTVISHPDPNSRLMVEETFGPVAPCVAFDDFDEAIEMANRTRFGLASMVMTTSAPRALRAIHSLRAGMVKINTLRGKAPGGSSEPVKASGLGHGYGMEFFHEITTQKSVHWRALPS